MRKVIPTIFAKNIKEFDEKFDKIVNIADEIQIDFMGGKFVGENGIPLKDVHDLKKYKGKTFEAHLMVAYPERWIKKLKEKGFKRILFHYSAVGSINKTVKVGVYIKSLGLKPVVVFNPLIPMKKIIRVSELFNHVMFMGHRPGREGLGLRPGVLRKIKKLRKINKKVIIQVDGAVNNRTIGKMKEAGVNIVNPGSYVSGAKDVREAKNRLKGLEYRFI